MAFFRTILGDSFCLACTFSFGILFSDFTNFQKIPLFHSLPYPLEENILRDNRNILKAQPLFTNVITTTLRRCSLSSLMSQLLLSKGAITLHGLYKSSLRLSRANDTKKLMGPPLISGVPLTNTKTKLDLTKLFSRYHHDNYVVQI